MLVFFLRELIVCYNFLRNNERREGRKNEDGDGDVGYLHKKVDLLCEMNGTINCITIHFTQKIKGIEMDYQ